jgi:DNA-binding MarR family transcriptional regulator
MAIIPKMATSKRQAKPKTRQREMTPEVKRVLRLFRVIFSSVRKHFRATEASAGTTGAHVWALNVIDEHPGIGVNDLAAAMDIHQSTASNLLRALAQSELVLAERDPLDKRAVRLKVTARGARLLKKAPGPYSGVLPDALLELDPKALKRLERDLQGLAHILSPTETDSQLPLGMNQR